MRVVFVFFFTCIALFALSPINSIKAGGNVIDIVYQNGDVVVGTDNGIVEIYDVNSTKLKNAIVFEKIKDFTGEEIGAKVYSVDKMENEDVYLAVVQGESFYRRLYLVENGTLKVVVDLSQKLMMKKAKFINKSQVLIALMSNELILYDIKKQKKLYRVTLSQSQFSDFALNEDRSKVASASESGGIAIVDVQSGKIEKFLDDGNVDNIYKVDFKKGKVISAGQDRRGIVYDIKSGKFDRYDAPFLIYACALSPSGSLGALAINEDNDIGIYDLYLKSKIAVLKGQKSTLNSIVFIDENNLVSGSDDKYIMIWRLK